MEENVNKQPAEQLPSSGEDGGETLEGPQGEE